MQELTVIVTSEPDKKLGKIIEGLREDSGYGYGREVRKDEKVSGKYILTIHDGEENLEPQSVRIANGMILAGKATGVIESVLRRNKIPYQQYSNIKIENPNAPILDIKLPEKPELSYAPYP